MRNVKRVKKYNIVHTKRMRNHLFQFTVKKWAIKIVEVIALINRKALTLRSKTKLKQNV